MYFIAKFLKFAWHSPTIMTWGSFLSRSLNLVLVTPLILSRFSTADISLWFIFSTIIGIQMLVDMGFSPTFTRVIAYAMGGASHEELTGFREPKSTLNKRPPNWDTVERIFATMSSVYSVLTIFLVLLFCIVGSFSLLKPISHVSDTFAAWICWIIIIVTSALNLKFTSFSSYLQGTNNIALLRRWETYISLCSILSNYLVLIFGGKLLELVLSHQAWRVINILANRHISFAANDERLKYFKNKGKDSIVLKAVWPSTWRSGLGIFMSRGLIDVSGIVYANLAATPLVATYLLGLRLITFVSTFSQAPFYSKLPVLSRLRASGDLFIQVTVAKKSMRYAYWCFVIAFSILGIIGPRILFLLNSHAEFPDGVLWSILGLAFFVERYGAMHIQLYSTSNHIIWHKANGISGLLYALLSGLSYNVLGIYAFPVSLLISYIAFYCWYSASHSYKMLETDFWDYEKSTSIMPTVVLLIFCCLYVTIGD